MGLQAWRENGWLVEHQTSPQEIADLLGVADRDLMDCQTPGLSTQIVQALTHRRRHAIRFFSRSFS